MKIVEVCYLLVQYKIGLMCNVVFSIKDFCELVNELGMLLVYEVIVDLDIELYILVGWVGLVMVQCIVGVKIIVVLILCVGLGMFSGVLLLILVVCVSVVGLQCDEEILQLVFYFECLIGCLEECDVLIFDLMLVIGGMLIVIIDMFKCVGVCCIKGIFLVVVFEGIEVVKVVYLDVEIYMVVIDVQFNDKGYILFGLGDVGDCIFGICVG